MHHRLLGLGGAEEVPLSGGGWYVGRDLRFLPPAAEGLAMLVKEREEAGIFKNFGRNDLEQIEDAPEFAPKVKLDDELVRKHLRGEVNSVR